MSKAARKIRQAKKLAQRQKRKAEKKARFAAAQERRHRRKAEKKGKWRGINRFNNGQAGDSRNRGHNGISAMTLKAFDRLLARQEKV